MQGAVAHGRNKRNSETDFDVIVLGTFYHIVIAGRPKIYQKETAAAAAANKCLNYFLFSAFGFDFNSVRPTLGHAFWKIYPGLGMHRSGSPWFMPRRSLILDPADCGLWTQSKEKFKQYIITTNDRSACRMFEESLVPPQPLRSKSSKPETQLRSQKSRRFAKRIRPLIVLKIDSFLSLIEMSSRRLFVFWPGRVNIAINFYKGC